MPLARVRSGALVGIEGIPLDVEVDIGSGMPGFFVVGHALEDEFEMVAFSLPVLRQAGNPQVGVNEIRLVKEGALKGLERFVASVVARDGFFLAGRQPTLPDLEGGHGFRMNCCRFHAGVFYHINCTIHTFLFPFGHWEKSLSTIRYL